MDQDAAPGPRRPLRRLSTAGSAASSTRRSISSCTWPRTRRSPARQATAPRARERDDDLQLLEYCRQLELRSSSRRRARSTATSTASTIRRGDRRLRLHGEPVLGVEDRSRGIRLLVCPLLRPAYCLSLLERLRPLRQRPAADGARDPALHPPLGRGEPITVFGGEERCSTSPTSTTASTGSRAGSSAWRAAGSRTRRSTSPTARATRLFARPS